MQNRVSASFSEEKRWLPAERHLDAGLWAAATTTPKACFAVVSLLWRQPLAGFARPTFAGAASAASKPAARRNRSLFGSFSSEKELLPC
jgi:hypothetical protein